MFKGLDRELEKLAMLSSIEEGLFGLYQLFENLSDYPFLTLPEKYAVLYTLLRELLFEELAILEEFYDSHLIAKVRDVQFGEWLLILDNPRSWDLNARPTFSLRLTSKGQEFMAMNHDKLKQLEEKRGYFKSWISPTKTSQKTDVAVAQLSLNEFVSQTELAISGVHTYESHTVKNAEAERLVLIKEFSQIGSADPYSEFSHFI